VLRYPDFRRYAIARFCSTLAWQMLGVAVGWQVYALTHDPLDLGLIGLAQFLPFLSLVLPAGHLADRADRRLVCVLAYAVEALCPLALLLFTLSGSTQVWPVFVAMALFGAGRAFWMPTGQALLVNMVPEHVFPSAVGFGATIFEVATISGPALGGVLYALGDAKLPVPGAAVVYAVALLLLIITLYMFLRLTPNRAKAVAVGSSLREVFEGLRFVLRHRPVLGAISLDLFAVLFGGATALLPIYACTPTPPVSGCCVRRRVSAPRSPPACWRRVPFSATPAAGCSAACSCSARRPSSSVFRRRCGCQ
jgi:MFS family permease